MVSILISTSDTASINIKEKLIEKKEFLWQKNIKIHEISPSVLTIDENFEQQLLNDEFAIVASKHRSATGFPCLTAHFPGNVSSLVKPEMGGKPQTLGIGYGSLLSAYIKNLDNVCKKSNFSESVVIEQDHHGPTINVPILFVEIGSTEQEWSNHEYANIVAESIMHTLNGFRKSANAFLAVGNTHYPTKFTEMIINQEYCFSHIFSKYTLQNLTEHMLKQSIEKSVEKVIGIVLDWKSIDSKHRSFLLNFADANNLEIVRV